MDINYFVLWVDIEVLHISLFFVCNLQFVHLITLLNVHSELETVRGAEDRGNKIEKGLCSLETDFSVYILDYFLRIHF